MDELSILQYYRLEAQLIGAVECKLVIIDFLDGEDGEKPMFCAFSHCEQMAQKLKLCGGCRSIRYCSIKCQKAGTITKLFALNQSPSKFKY